MSPPHAGTRTERWHSSEILEQAELVYGGRKWVGGCLGPGWVGEGTPNMGGRDGLHVTEAYIGLN